MFTASLNLEALQQAIQGRICAAEGCDKPVPQGAEADAQYCSDHAKELGQRRQRGKKARR